MHHIEDAGFEDAKKRYILHMYIDWYDKSHADVAKLIVICDITLYSIITNGWFGIWTFPSFKSKKIFPLFCRITGRMKMY